MNDLSPEKLGKGEKEKRGGSIQAFKIDESKYVGGKVIRTK